MACRATRVRRLRRRPALQRGGQRRRPPPRADARRSTPLGRPYEILLVDDGSRDGTLERAASSSRRATRACACCACAATSARPRPSPPASTTRAATWSSPRTATCRTTPPTSRALRARSSTRATTWSAAGAASGSDPLSQAAARPASRTGSSRGPPACTCTTTAARSRRCAPRSCAGLRLYGEMHRFIPAVASWMGVSVAEMPVNHRPAHARAQQVRPRPHAARAARPLHREVPARLRHAARAPLRPDGPRLRRRSASAILAYLAYIRLFQDEAIGGRPLLLLGALLFLTGVILVSFGLMAELLVRIYHESQGKPIYVVKEIAAASAARAEARARRCRGAVTARPLPDRVVPSGPGRRREPHPRPGAARSSRVGHAAPRW